MAGEHRAEEGAAGSPWSTGASSGWTSPTGLADLPALHAAAAAGGLSGKVVVLPTAA